MDKVAERQNYARDVTGDLWMRTDGDPCGDLVAPPPREHTEDVVANATMAMTVRVRDLPILADVGINPDEIGRRQPLVISMDVDLTDARMEAIAETVDYRRLVAEAEALALIHIPLIETFARRLAERFVAFDNVTRARISIDKPFAITRGMAGVEVVMNKTVPASRDA